MQIRKQRDVIPVRNLDRDLYRRVRFEAIRRRVNVAFLLNQMMRDWLSRNESKETNI